MSSRDSRMELTREQRLWLDGLPSASLQVFFALGSLDLEGTGVTATRISDELSRAGVHLSPVQVSNILRAAGRRVRAHRAGRPMRYSLMTAGQRELDAAVTADPLVVTVSEGKLFEARLRIEALLGTLAGTVRISDPYFGRRTLDLLAAANATATVRLLTARASGEKQERLERLAAELCQERSNVQVRIASQAKISHDRFVVTDKELIIVGHGLKDVGRRDSFIIRLDDSVASDARAEAISRFDMRWDKATAV